MNLAVGSSGPKGAAASSPVRRQQGEGKRPGGLRVQACLVCYLPKDILLLVCSHLPPTDIITTFSSCCRHFRSVVHAASSASVVASMMIRNLSLADHVQAAPVSCQLWREFVCGVTAIDSNVVARMRGDGRLRYGFASDSLCQERSAIALDSSTMWVVAAYCDRHLALVRHAATIAHATQSHTDPSSPSQPLSPTAGVSRLRLSPETICCNPEQLFHVAVFSTQAVGLYYVVFLALVTYEHVARPKLVGSLNARLQRVSHCMTFLRRARDMPLFGPGVIYEELRDLVVSLPARCEVPGSIAQLIDKIQRFAKWFQDHGHDECAVAIGRVALSVSCCSHWLQCLAASLDNNLRLVHLLVALGFTEEDLLPVGSDTAAVDTSAMQDPPMGSPTTGHASLSGDDFSGGEDHPPLVSVDLAVPLSSGPSDGSARDPATPTSVAATRGSALPADGERSDAESTSTWRSKISGGTLPGILGSLTGTAATAQQHNSCQLLLRDLIAAYLKDPRPVKRLMEQFARDAAL